MRFLKGRKLEVKLVGDDKPDELVGAPQEVIDYVEVVKHSSEFVAAAAITVIFAYMGADTLRQVIVKSTPTR